MAEIDQLGSFYLGRKHDLATGRTHAEPLLYDSKQLTTHAVCVGMTGSGKTGLCISLLEEAALDGIPAIVIDPKGDLGNLLLAFPNLAANDFRPWVDESEAASNGLSPDELAARVADIWREGLAQWDEGAERIRRFCDSVDRVIYTPGSTAGIPVAVLKSFDAPPKQLLDDSEALHERVVSAVSGLLALMDIDADPMRSREHILLSTILESCWRAGRSLDLQDLIHAIRNPPFDKVGVVDVDSFYPANDRYKLAMSLNNLVASPSFATWLQGEPLNIGGILRTEGGKPRLAIFSIAHLDDAQRMFFVTLLLNEVLAWIRTQPGTSSLRALLYMDEVFGYFPPVGNPPAKQPMLTLLKQARAYGLGCVLATQNPVDLDYKGLSNAGTWFLGRLQTERDKLRVIEGLEGASAEAGATFNRQQMEATLAALGKRVFLMNNVHEDAPVIFHTRWAMSYLAGPLTRNQIKTLMDPLRGRYGSLTGDEPGAPSKGASTPAAGQASAPIAQGGRPVLPADIRESFAAITERIPDGFRVEYRAAIVGKAKVHFVRKSSNVDVWRQCYLLQEDVAASPDDVWTGATSLKDAVATESQPDGGATFAGIPPELQREKSYPVFAKQLKEHLYREEALPLRHCKLVETTSEPEEGDVDFRARIAPLLGEKKAAERDKLDKMHASRLAAAEERIRRAQARLSTQRWQFFARLGSMVWVVADTILSAFGKGLPGRRRSLDPAFRSAATERGQQSNAQVSLETAIEEKQALEEDYEQKLKTLDAAYDPQTAPLEHIELKPLKGDIEIDQVSLVWLPWRIAADGAEIRAFSSS